MMKPAIHFRWSRRGLAGGGVAASALILCAALAHADSDSSKGGALTVDPVADLQPPPITVLQSRGGTARGLIFVAPKIETAVTGPQGPEITDDKGRPVWFHALANGDQAADFRVQQYRGQPVLTWTQGQGLGGVPITATSDYIVDRHYRVVAKVQAGNGLNADQHEFRLTARDTALIVIYNPVTVDLTPFGGVAGAKVVDGVFQEIDIASGRVLLEWHSLDHVGIDESHLPVPTSASPAPYDYFHINAVSVDDDGNLLVSARHTWAIYKVDRHTGHVLWRLGGTKTDFALGADVQFAWQHDPEAVDRHTVRIFDNEAAPAVRPRSRVVWIRRDPWSHTATLIRSFEHPDGLLAPSQGNSQALDNGDTFVGWGALGRFSEFDQAGQLLFDASVPAGYDTYRAYRARWHAEPVDRPIATARRNADGTTTVHAIWNGATDVVRWYVVGGSHAVALWPLGSADWNGLDTPVTITTDARQVAVVAQDADGRLIARSLPVPIAD